MVSEVDEGNGWDWGSFPFQGMVGTVRAVSHGIVLFTADSGIMPVSMKVSQCESWQV